MKRCEKTAVILAVILAAICSICTLFTPGQTAAMVKVISDSIGFSMNWGAIEKIAGLLVTILGINAICGVGQHLIMTRVTYRISRRMRSAVSEKIDRLPMAFFHQMSKGEILSRVTNDVDTIAQSLNQSLGMMIQAITLFVGSIIMMAYTNLFMMGIAVLSSLVGFWMMKMIMERSQDHFFAQQRYLGEMNGFIEEAYTGHLVVKVFGAEKKMNQKFSELNENLRDSSFIAQCFSGMMQPLMNFTGNLGYVAVCAAGALLVLNGSIGIEVIVAFMMYIHYFMQPLTQFAQIAQAMQATMAAGSRVKVFLQEKEMEEETCKKKCWEKVEGEIDFDHVNFCYPENEEYTIKHFTEKIMPGQKVAIVGPSGAGKTTLMNLLLRFYEITEGDIRIDGESVCSISREQLRENIAMVLQNDWVFEGTIIENLSMGNPKITMEQIENVCKELKLDRFMKRLPNGYDTVIDDRMSLSAGEKQQLSIARAMLSDKPILILDEATSSVDLKTEFEIHLAMEKLMKGRTVLIIAHRLSTIQNADKIIVLDHGKIAEAGTHEELLKENGLYFEMYHSQYYIS